MKTSVFFVGNLHVRERKPIGRPKSCVLFVHGATVGSVLFDFPIAGYSVLEAAAKAGWWAFAMDLRGYGKSRKDIAMGENPADSDLLCTGVEAVSDVEAALQFIRSKTGVERVVLAGGSWGSITVGRIAASQRESLAGIVLLAPLYAAVNPDWLNFLSDPSNPAQVSPQLGGWRYVTLEDLVRRWDAEIPDGETDRFREPFIAQTLFDAEASADADCPRSDAFRVPNGTLHDLFEVFNARPVYDASAIEVPTVLIRGENDETSTAEDAERLLGLLGTEHKVLFTIPRGGHFLQLERCAPRVQETLVEALRRCC